jgi:DNA helicase-2/ATP-dependent DNA helicase PcrA
VYVLNVVDGSFPSEFATGDESLIEEERRLLYVAMTRARDALHLLAPLRFPVTQQPARGDGHVYGGRSRFLTGPVLQCLDRVAHVTPAVAPGGAPRPMLPRVDAQTKLRDLF